MYLICSSVMFNIFLHTVYTCIKIVRILLLLGWTIKNILLRRLLKIFRYVTEKRGRKREGERERERERQNTTEWFYIKKQICNYYFKTIFTNNIPTITPNLSLKKSFLCGGDVLRKRNASRIRGLFPPLMVTRWRAITSCRRFMQMCALRVTIRATDTRLLPVSHRVSTLRFPSVFLPAYPLPLSSSLVNIFIFLSDMENYVF